MKKIIKNTAKAAIVAGSSIGMNYMFSYFAPTYKAETITRLLTNIAGLSIGFVIGDVVSDAVIIKAEKMIASLGGEELYSED